MEGRDKKNKGSKDFLSSYLLDAPAKSKLKVDRLSLLELALIDYRDVSKRKHATPLQSRLLQSLESTSWTERIRTLEAIALFSELFPLDVKSFFQSSEVLPILLRRTIDDAAAHPGKRDAEHVRDYSLALISRWLKKTGEKGAMQSAESYIIRKRLLLPPPLDDEKIPLLLSQRTGVHLLLSSSSDVRVNLKDEPGLVRKIGSDADIVGSLTTSVDVSPGKITDDASTIISDTRGCVSSAMSLLKMIVPDLQDDSTEDTFEDSLSFSAEAIDRGGGGGGDNDGSCGQEIKDEEWEDVPEKSKVTSAIIHERSSNSPVKRSIDSTVVLTRSVASDEAADTIMILRDSVFLLWQEYLPQLERLLSQMSTGKSTDSSVLPGSSRLTKLIADAKRVIEIAKTVGIDPEAKRGGRKRKYVEEP